MAMEVSVCDRQFSGQVQQVLQALRKLGCDKANTLYILTPADLASAAINMHSLKTLQMTAPTVVFAAENKDAPQARIVNKLLEDKSSRDVAFKLSVNLLA
jgi:hypothetical protein